MRISVYNQLSADCPTFLQAKVTDLFEIISYKYHKYFYHVGEFEVVAPINSPTAELVKAGMIFYTDSGDSLIVTDIEETEQHYTFTGYDLNYLLHNRLTLFPEEAEAGTYGYYTAKGSSEYIIKKLVNYNISASSDEERQVYGFFIRANSDRGIENDRIMTRLEPLDEVISSIAQGAGLGFAITIDFDNNRYVFDVYEPTDKTDNQHVRNSVVFDLRHSNISKVARTVGVSSEVNAIYAINSGGSAEPIVKCVNRAETPACGWNRHESTVNTSAELAEEIDAAAINAAGDYVPIDELELTPADADNYGTLYNVGDKVSFRYKNNYLDTLITDAEINYSGHEKSIVISCGSKKPGIIRSISRKSGTAENTAVKAILDGGSGSGIPAIVSIQVNDNFDFNLNTNSGTERYIAVVE